jgi:hypothetical protein
VVNLNRDDSYLPVGQFDMITELSRLRRAAQDGAVPAEFLAMVQRFTDEQIASKLADRNTAGGCTEGSLAVDWSHVRVAVTHRRCDPGESGHLLGGQLKRVGGGVLLET